jgi:hypothetical protein
MKTIFSTTKNKRKLKYIGNVYYIKNINVVVNNTIVIRLQLIHTNIHLFRDLYMHSEKKKNIYNLKIQLYIAGQKPPLKK